MLLHTRQSAIQNNKYQSWSCSKALYIPVWHIPLLSVRWINSWWWTEELSETCRVSYQNKFEKSVHLVGFIIKKFVAMHGHMKLESATNISRQRKAEWDKKCKCTFFSRQVTQTSRRQTEVVFLLYQLINQEPLDLIVLDTQGALCIIHYACPPFRLPARPLPLF